MSTHVKLHGHEWFINDGVRPWPFPPEKPKHVLNLPLARIELEEYRPNEWMVHLNGALIGWKDGVHPKTVEEAAKWALTAVATYVRQIFDALRKAQPAAAGRSRYDRLNQAQAIEFSQAIDKVQEALQQLLAHWHDFGQSHWTGGSLSDPGEQNDAPAKSVQDVFTELHRAQDAIALASHHAIMHAMELPS